MSAMVNGFSIDNFAILRKILLKERGQMAIVSVPAEHIRSMGKHLRKVVGKEYREILFSTEYHPAWIGNSLCEISEKAHKGSSVVVLNSEGKDANLPSEIEDYQPEWFKSTDDFWCSLDFQRERVEGSKLTVVLVMTRDQYAFGIKWSRHFFDYCSKIHILDEEIPPEWVPEEVVPLGKRKEPEQKEECREIIEPEDMKEVYGRNLPSLRESLERAKKRGDNRITLLQYEYKPLLRALQAAGEAGEVLECEIKMQEIRSELEKGGKK